MYIRYKTPRHRCVTRTTSIRGDLHIHHPRSPLTPRHRSVNSHLHAPRHRCENPLRLPFLSVLLVGFHFAHGEFTGRRLNRGGWRGIPSIEPDIPLRATRAAGSSAYSSLSSSNRSRSQTRRSDRLVWMADLKQSLHEGTYNRQGSVHHQPFDPVISDE